MFLISKCGFSKLKVLSYWNLNQATNKNKNIKNILKVLSYWNLNVYVGTAPINLCKA